MLARHIISFQFSDAKPKFQVMRPENNVIQSTTTRRLKHALAKYYAKRRQPTTCMVWYSIKTWSGG